MPHAAPVCELRSQAALPANRPSQPRLVAHRSVQPETRLPARYALLALSVQRRNHQPRRRSAPAPHSAIREGDDKLIFDWSGKLYLYDLKTDWREEHNLADVQTEKTGALLKKLNAWLDQNVAVKYMRAAAEEKLSVPRNLSVVGVDDIPLGEYLPVALTTISQPIKDMVARTASLLVQRIDGKSAVRPSQTIFPTELLIRESTARGPGRIRR